MNNALARWETYSPVSIGLEDMFSRLDAFHDHNTPSYPPYNIVKLDDTTQQLQIALAGFNKEDIEVAVEMNVLNISTKRAEETVGDFIHKGIARRTFSKNWQLSDDTEVDEVTFVNGLLCVTLRRVIPEEKQRKLFDIA